MKFLEKVAVFALSLGGLTVALAQDPPRSKPVVAIIAQNAGTEVTDLLVPFGILADSALVDVHAVALADGAVTLLPAPGAVELPDTVAKFDAAHARGADFVIVPAVVDPDAAALHTWLRAQHSKGALIMSICDGAKVLAQAGLLKGRTATAHWYSLTELRKQFPEANWRDDRRYIFDGKVATTSGVSASVPATFALLERIVGADATARYAGSLGVVAWSAAHDGAAFPRVRKELDVAAGMRAPAVTIERVGFAVPERFDEAKAALVMDAYSRTDRSSVVMHSGDATEIRSRHGLVFRTDRGARAYEVDERILQQPLAQTLEETLNEIERNYGVLAADRVANQLEYVRSRVDALAPR